MGKSKKLDNFEIVIYMKDGTRRKGVRQAENQYVLSREYGEKLKRWKEYPNVEGFKIVKLKS